MKQRTLLMVGGVGLLALWFLNSNSDSAQTLRGSLAGWVSDKWSSNYQTS